MNIGQISLTKSEHGHKAASGHTLWLSRDPIAENGGINLYAYVGNNPINFYDPYGLVRWGDLGRAGLGIVTNGLGVATAVGMAAMPSGVTQVAAVPIALKSGYGIGANLRNAWSALKDDCPTSTGSLVGDAANAIAPDNKQAQQAAAAIDLGLDLASGQIAKRAFARLGGASPLAFPAATYHPFNPADFGNVATGFQAASIADTTVNNLGGSGSEGVGSDCD